MASYTFTLPIHTTPLNRLLGSWKRAGRLKTIDREAVGLCFKAAGVTPAAGKRRVRLLITLAPGQRACDPDAYQKSIGDALKHCGGLVDDNRQGVEWTPAEFARGRRRSMTITLEDIP